MLVVNGRDARSLSAIRACARWDTPSKNARSVRVIEKTLACALSIQDCVNDGRQPLTHPPKEREMASDRLNRCAGTAAALCLGACSVVACSQPSSVAGDVTRAGGASASSAGGSNGALGAREYPAPEALTPAVSARI